MVEDKGNRILLDFEVQMGKLGDFYAEFLKPRNLNGMGDLFEFGLLPRLKGLYRRDYSLHTNYEDSKTETLYNAVLVDSFTWIMQEIFIT